MKIKYLLGTTVLVTMLVGYEGNSNKEKFQCDGEGIQEAIVDSFVNETFRRLEQQEDKETRKVLTETLSKSLKVSFTNPKLIKIESDKGICQANASFTINDPFGERLAIKKEMKNLTYKVSKKNNKTVVEFDSKFWDEINRP